MVDNQQIEELEIQSMSITNDPPSEADDSREADFVYDPDGKK